MPIVSVIIPVYNAEQFIDRCLESIVNQTYTEFEILLMVGVCADDSAEKCLEWEKKDGRISVVVRHWGCAEARNYGLEIAKGKYIAYVDADDYIDSHFLEKMIRPLEIDETVDVSCCGFARFDGSGMKDVILPKCTGKVVSINPFDYLDMVGYGVVWLRVYKRDWLVEKNIKMYDGGHEDDAMAIMMAVRVKKVFYLNEALYFYNMENEDSMMHHPENHYDYCNALAYALNYLQSEGLYEPVKYEIRKRCVSGIRNIGSLMGSDRHFEETVEVFLNNYFPEVIEDIRFRKERKLKKTDRIVLFGAGADGRQFLQKHSELTIAYIVDNNEKRQNASVGKLSVYGFEKLLSEKETVTVIITSKNFYYDIAKQLRDNGIENYVAMDEYTKRLYEGE